jgi:hypothetical protein
MPEALEVPVNIRQASCTHEQHASRSLTQDRSTRLHIRRHSRRVRALQRGMVVVSYVGQALAVRNSISQVALGNSPTLLQYATASVTEEQNG